MQKPALAAAVIAMVALSVYLSRVNTLTLSDQPALSAGAQHFKEEIDNQIRRAKYRLFQAATSYSNSIALFDQAVTKSIGEREAQRLFCPGIAASTGRACPPPPSLDIQPYLMEIESKAASLSKAASQFEAEVSEIRYRACKQLGYLCRSGQDPSASAGLWVGLPPTEYDEAIAQAMNQLPDTPIIIKRTIARWRDYLKG
jgi:hypothetical protein